MRISDWSSDVCSSDLWPALCRLMPIRGTVFGHPPPVEPVDDPRRWRRNREGTNDGRHDDARRGADGRRLGVAARLRPPLVDPRRGRVPLALFRYDSRAPDHRPFLYRTRTPFYCDPKYE